ncbi:MAG: hypothetical protein WCP85_01960 [Mariniphaga sp.]
MSHDDGWNPSSGASIHPVDIAAADADSFHIDQYLISPELWSRNFLKFNFLVFC